MRNKNRSIVVILVFLLSIVTAMSACTKDPTARILEKKGYKVEIQTSEKNAIVDYKIKKQIYAYDSSTGDHILITDYKDSVTAKEFYNKHKDVLKAGDISIVIRNKRVAYGTKEALKILKYIKK